MHPDDRRALARYRLAEALPAPRTVEAQLDRWLQAWYAADQAQQRRALLRDGFFPAPDPETSPLTPRLQAADRRERACVRAIMRYEPETPRGLAIQAHLLAKLAQQERAEDGDPARLADRSAAALDLPRL